MARLEIVVGQDWQDDVRYLSELRPFRPADSPLNLVEIRDIFDLVVDGRNLTACVDEESIFGLVANLVESMVDLIEGRLKKAIVEFPSEPFELVMVPDANRLLLSLYSVDRRRRVVALDKPVDARAFAGKLASTAEELLADLLRIDERFSTDPFVRSFSSDLSQLKRAKGWTLPARDVPTLHGLAGSTSSQRGLTLSYEVSEPGAAAEYQGEHVFDLHALLVRGELSCEFGGQLEVLEAEFPILALQAAMRRVRELLNLLEANRSSFECDSDLHRFRFEIQADGPRWIMRIGEDIQFESGPNECLDSILSLAELIVNDLLGINGRLQLNQRFVDLKTDVEDLRAWFEDLSETNKYLETPEDYLESHAHVQPEEYDRKDATFSWPMSSVRALYPSQKWVFRTPRIHFAAMTQADDTILVPTTERLIALDAGSGEELWRASEKAGASLSSYSLCGRRVILANERADLHLVDLRSGEDVAKVDAPELGTLLLDSAYYPDSDLAVVADFHGQITGFDPATGKNVWNYASGHGYLTGVAFEGPIVCTLSSPGFLQALDSLTGRTLWKVRLGGVADSGPHAHQGRLYTFSHDPMTRQMTVQAFHPFTGRTAWQVRLEGSLVGRPNFLDDWMVLPVERHGQVQLVGLPLEAYDPGPEWNVELRSAGLDRPTSLAGVELDGEPHGLVRTDRAEITCFRLKDGEVRWRTRPESENQLLFRNLDLVIVRDSIMTVTDCIEFRSLENGEVLHAVGDILEAPEYLAAMGNLTVLVGEPGNSEDGDQLVCLRLGHYLAVVD